MVVFGLGSKFRNNSRAYLIKLDSISFLKVVYWKSTLSILPSKPSVFPITQNIKHSPKGVYGESTLPVFALGSIQRINSFRIALESIQDNCQ